MIRRGAQTRRGFLLLAGAAFSVSGRGSAAAPGWVSLPFDVPGRDYPAGLRKNVDGLNHPERDALPDGCRYDASLQRIVVARAGVTLSGWDFRDLANLLITEGGCVIRDCLFGARRGFFGITTGNAPDLTIECCTLDGERLATDYQGLLQASDTTYVTVRNCRFVGTPGDCLQIAQGVIERCHLRSGGFQSGQHADLVFVPWTVGEGVTIRENLLDCSDESGTTTGPHQIRRGINNCIQAGAVSARPGMPQPSIRALVVSRNVIIGHSVAFPMSFGKAAWTGSGEDRRVVTGCVVAENYILPRRTDQLVVHPQARPAYLGWRDNRHLLTGALIPAPRGRG